MNFKDRVMSRISSKNKYKMKEIFSVLNIDDDSDVKLIFTEDILRVIRLLDEYKYDSSNIVRRLDILAGKIKLVPDVVVEDEFTVLVIKLDQEFGRIVSTTKKMLIYQPEF